MTYNACGIQVDVLVLILHWGTEYMHEPKPEQVDMAHEFLNAVLTSS